MTYAQAFSKIQKLLTKADTSAMNEDYAIQITFRMRIQQGHFMLLISAVNFL